jgi:hypothetical protein
MSNYEKDTPIDLAELELFAEAEQAIDPEANMDDAAPPPPEFDAEGRDIKYLVIPEVVTDKTSQRQVKTITYKSNGRDVTGLQFYGLICSIQDEGKPWNKSRLRSWPSTRLMNQTTEVDQIIKAYLGMQAYMANKAHLWPVGQKVKFLMEKFSAQQPFRVTVRWEASHKKFDEQGNPVMKNGKQEYETIYKGMRSFPTRQAPDGTIVHVPIDAHPTKEGVEVQTQARIVSYYPA